MSRAIEGAVLCRSGGARPAVSIQTAPRRGSGRTLVRYLPLRAATSCMHAVDLRHSENICSRQRTCHCVFGPGHRSCYGLCRTYVRWLPEQSLIGIETRQLRAGPSACRVQRPQRRKRPRLAGAARGAAAAAVRRPVAAVRPAPPGRDTADAAPGRVPGAVHARGAAAHGHGPPAGGLRHAGRGRSIAAHAGAADVCHTGHRCQRRRRC